MLRDALARIFALAFTFLLAGCSNGLDRPIKIVLPNDYRGEFTIVKDQRGSPFTVTPDYYVFVIPPSGELRTPDIDPFFKWHQVRVEYADGRVLQDYSQDLFSNLGLRVESDGTTAGQRQTSSSSWESSSDYDGTTMRWKVVETP